MKCLWIVLMLIFICGCESQCEDYQQLQAEFHSLNRQIDSVQAQMSIKLDALVELELLEAEYADEIYCISDQIDIIQADFNDVTIAVENLICLGVEPNE